MRCIRQMRRPRLLRRNAPATPNNYADASAKERDMAWNISAGAIKNPIPPIVLILALLFAGVTAYLQLPVNQLPNIEFPVFTVGVSQPGAAPAEMETQVAQRVEAALTAVQGVRRVTTSISPGYSQTVVQLQIGA